MPAKGGPPGAPACSEELVEQQPDKRLHFSKSAAYVRCGGVCFWWQQRGLPLPPLAARHCLCGLCMARYALSAMPSASGTRRLRVTAAQRCGGTAHRLPAFRSPAQHQRAVVRLLDPLHVPAHRPGSRREVLLAGEAARLARQPGGAGHPLAASRCCTAAHPSSAPQPKSCRPSAPCPPSVSGPGSPVHVAHDCLCHRHPAQPAVHGV